VDFDDDDDDDDDFFCACGKVHPPTWRHSLADPAGPALPPLGPDGAGGSGAGAPAVAAGGPPAAPAPAPAAAGPPPPPLPAAPHQLDGLIAEADARAKVQATGSYEGSLRGSTATGEPETEGAPPAPGAAVAAAEQGEAAVLPSGARQPARSRTPTRAPHDVRHLLQAGAGNAGAAAACKVQAGAPACPHSAAALAALWRLRASLRQ